MSKYYRRYKVSWCRRCSQDWVRLMKDNETGDLFFYCEECMTLYKYFQDIAERKGVFDSKYDVEPAFSEIKARGWQKYILPDDKDPLKFIGIGLVYSFASASIQQTLTLIIDFLLQKQGSVKKISWTKDRGGKELFESLVHEKNEVVSAFDHLINNFNGFIDIDCTLFDLPLNISLRIKSHKPDYFGLLIDIPQLQISDIIAISLEELEARTEKIIDFAKEIYTIVPFEYAVCDYEAQINYSPQAFAELINDHLYSVVIVPQGDGDFKIVKNERQINKITTRVIHD